MQQVRAAHARDRAKGVAERWRWGAWQTLLYAGERYVRLLRGLPRCTETLELTDAAVTVM